MLSFSFPNWEIHNSKEPIAMLIHPTRKMQAYKLRSLGGKYFYIREGRRYDGIFELDPTLAYHYGKTPVYVFDSRNSRPISPIFTNELAKWAKTNKLTTIKPKDKIHGDRLRKLAEKTDSLESAQNTIHQDAKAYRAKMKDYLDDLQKVDTVAPEHIGYLLTNFLVEQEMLTTEEKGVIDAKLANGTMDNVSLINYLKDREVIQISTPLDMDASKFLEDFGSYNPDQLASFVDRLRRDDKGLKSLTSTPVKNWIPASIILALLVGGSIAIAVVLQNAGNFENLIPNFSAKPKTPPQAENTTKPPEPPKVIEPAPVAPIVQPPAPVVEVPAVVETPPVIEVPAEPTVQAIPKNQTVMPPLP
jgi:hypothetical protein